MVDLLILRGAEVDILNFSNERPIDKTSYPLLQRKLDRAAQAKMDGSEDPKEQIVNWMGVTCFSTFILPTFSCPIMFSFFHSSF